MVMSANEKWLEQLLESTPGYESEVFEQFAQRLLGLARTRLPQKMSARVDADDVVQSVFRTFFRRHTKGQFHFESEYDVWHLLAAITYRKVLNTIRFHNQDLRNATREHPNPDQSPILADPNPGPESVMIMMDYTRWILDRLPDQHRQVMQLRMEGHTVREVAEHVGLSERSVKRVLSRVRQLAAERLAEEARPADSRDPQD